MRIHALIHIAAAATLAMVPVGAQGPAPPPRIAGPDALPGVLPQSPLDSGPPLGALAYESVDIRGVLTDVADSGGIAVLAEVYPNTEWDQPRPLSVPGGSAATVLAAVSAAFDYEWGEVEGIYLLRKTRPWEQPQTDGVAPEDVSVVRREAATGGDGEGPAIDLSCDGAPFADVLGRLNALSPTDADRVAHPSLSSHRIFARLTGVPIASFHTVAARLIGADLVALPPSLLFTRSAGMAWRAAAARHEEDGPPDFETLADQGDTAAWDGLSLARRALLVSLCTRLDRQSAMRFNEVVIAPAEKLADMPTALWVLRQYSTRTVSFEELARDEQLAFIAELNACEQADPALKVDRSWPEAMCVTLRRGSADSPDETKLACELTCGMTDGGSVTF
ncbi:MAG TPA: hypothetical protein QGH10_12270 [Armatimonadota bacterium]|nr:hypothetical protein [Armatimonadota bacterium]